MKQPIRILLADDHSIMRIGLASLLSREKDMTVVGEAATGEEAVALARKLKPDVVVMDLMMPVLSGAEATRQITTEVADSAAEGEAESRPRVLVFTSYGTSADLAAAVLNGASGVLLKNAPTRDLPQAIRKVFAGEKVLSDEIQALVDEESSLARLTERQLELLGLAARGFTNQEIADQLGVSLITVKKQFSDIFVRLSVSNRAEAISFALQRHIIRNMQEHCMGGINSLQLQFEFARNLTATACAPRDTARGTGVWPRQAWRSATPRPLRDSRRARRQ